MELNEKEIAGFSKLNKRDKIYWDNGLYAACQTNNMCAVQLIIKERKEKLDYLLGFRCACLSGHFEIVKLMINKGEKNWYKQAINRWWFAGIGATCEGLVRFKNYTRQTSGMDDDSRTNASERPWLLVRGAFKTT